MEIIEYGDVAITYLNYARKLICHSTYKTIINVVIVKKESK